MRRARVLTIRFSPDGSTGYITDSGTRGAIIVVDLDSGSAFRALDGHASTQIDKTVTVASVTKTVAISAPKKQVLLTAQGAYIKLEGGNIEVHAPGKVEFKASKKEVAGPQSASGEKTLPKPGDLKVCEFRAAGAAAAGDSTVPLS